MTSGFLTSFIYVIMFTIIFVTSLIMVNKDPKKYDTSLHAALNLGLSTLGLFAAALQMILSR